MGVRIDSVTLVIQAVTMLLSSSMLLVQPCPYRMEARTDMCDDCGETVNKDYPYSGNGVCIVDRASTPIG